MGKEFTFNGDTGDVGLILGSERFPWRRATHSSVLAWEIPWMEVLEGTVHGAAESDTTKGLDNSNKEAIGFTYQGFLTSMLKPVNTRYGKSRNLPATGGNIYYYSAWPIINLAVLIQDYLAWTCTSEVIHRISEGRHFHCCDFEGLQVNRRQKLTQIPTFPQL